MGIEINEMEKARLKQWEYLDKAIPKIKNWAKVNRCRIYKINSVPHIGKSLDIYIFYKTDKELKRYRELNLLEATEDTIANILTEIGYVREFNNNIRISFDSKEYDETNIFTTEQIKIFFDQYEIQLLEHVKS